MSLLKQSTSTSRSYFLGVGLTNVTLDSVSINGATFSTPSSSVNAITGVDGWYKANIDAGDVGTLGDIAFHFIADVGIPVDPPAEQVVLALPGEIIDVANVQNNVVGDVNGNVVGTVQTVAGDVNGNVNGSVGGVLGDVTGNVNGDMGGKVLGGGSSAFLTPGVIADSVQGNIGGSVSSVANDVTIYLGQGLSDSTTIGDAIVKINTLAVQKGKSRRIPFVMVLASDHLTPATGKTVAGQMSLDGGVFVDVNGVIAEIGSGVYNFVATADDLQADSATFLFTASGCDPRALVILTQFNP